MKVCLPGPHFIIVLTLLAFVYSGGQKIKYVNLSKLTLQVSVHVRNFLNEVQLLQSSLCIYL